MNFNETSYEELEDICESGENSHELEEIFYVYREDDNLMARMAMNSKTPSKILDNLAGHENPDVRLSVAMNSSTPPKALENFLLDEDEEYEVVRFTVRNSSTPPERLRDFLDTLEAEEYPDKDILESMASNKKLPIDLLTRLSHNDYENVREKVAANPSTPTHVLDYLAKDFSNYVKRGVAYNPNISQRSIQYLSGLNNHEIDLALANNEKTPPVILDKLSYSKYPNVLLAIAKNGRTSQDTLKRMYENALPDDIRLKKEIAANPNMTDDVHQQFIREYKEFKANNVSEFEGVPKINYTGMSSQNIKSRSNPDLELLLRLKNFIN